MSLNHNTVYPRRHLITIGDVSKGFVYYGPFEDHDAAWEWAVNNLHVGTHYKITEMFDVSSNL